MMNTEPSCIRVTLLAAMCAGVLATHNGNCWAAHGGGHGGGHGGARAPRVSASHGGSKAARMPRANMPARATRRTPTTLRT